MHLRIGGHFELRTLKRSARKQLERERAQSLWIIPWLHHKSLGSGKQVHPQASLLGLPAELRQRIVYESYATEELLRNAKKFIKGKGTQGERLRRLTWADKAHRTSSGKDSTLYKSQIVADYLVLGHKIGVLSQVSGLFYQDMKYVGRRWREDLKEYLDLQLQLEFGDDIFDLPSVLNMNVQSWRRKKGEVIKAENRKPGKSARPPKCWYCTERHFDGDPVCPMARREPHKWQEMTKPVGRRKHMPYKRSTFKGKKVAFKD
jgi:hypothetical protein